MFGIGIPEFILILVVGLIVFGPSKLPEIGRAVGKGLREFKKASNAFQNILNAPDDDTPARTMAATHGGEKTAAELAAEEKADEAGKPTENSAVKEADTKVNLNKQEEKAEKQETYATETAYGYTPPTKESVQAEMDMKLK